jgi:hypothetical protein
MAKRALLSCVSSVSQCLSGFMILLVVGATVVANGVTVSRHTNEPPAEIAAPAKALLAPGGATAKVGENTIEFWWVKSLDSKSKDWTGVAEGALVGAMKISAPFRDIRGRTLKAGTYLLRYGLQPQNGDHLGVSPHREFLLATPAGEDTAPEALGHDAAVDLAKKSIGISHPAVLSLDPPVSTAAPLAVAQTDAGHTSVTFEVPTAQGPLKFGLVLVGLIEA